MSSETTNLHLVKPTSADTADIGIINGNMDIIDDAVADKVDTTDMAVFFGVPVPTAQVFNINFTCKNASNSHNGHAMTLAISDSGILLWDVTTSSTVWSK